MIDAIPQAKTILFFSSILVIPGKINELDFALAQESLCSSRDWKQGTKARWRIMVEELKTRASTHYSAAILRLALPDCDCRWDCTPVVQEGVLSLKLHNFCIAAERITHRSESGFFLSLSTIKKSLLKKNLC